MSDEREQGYLRLLDSLARFYNSQMTAHVGYFLTSVFGYFAILSLIMTAKWIDAILSIIFSIKLSGYEPLINFIFSVGVGIAYFTQTFPLLPRYQFARIQYYIALSEMVWIHMGLTRPEQKFFQQLKNRALRLGIMPGVTSMFEATLYISLCRKEREDWKEIFDLKEFEIQPGYKGRKVLGFDLSNLLWIAYQQQIKGYLKVEDKTSRAYRIGELFKEYVDC